MIKIIRKNQPFLGIHRASIAFYITVTLALFLVYMITVIPAPDPLYYSPAENPAFLYGVPIALTFIAMTKIYDVFDDFYELQWE